MDVDKILNQINPFGKYQKFVLVLIGLMSSLGAMAIYSTVFYSAEPIFTCNSVRRYGNNYLETNMFDQNQSMVVSRTSNL